ncbi:hypothetical protein ON010_g17798 [Phytophthora cinnamomi]|nr:hypothetical protein ON010_g17798 [Phytophthora cinnamomi]
MAPGGPADSAGDKPRTSFGTLILLRHGQSVWNRKPDRPMDLWRYAGSIDIPLRHAGSVRRREEARVRADRRGLLLADGSSAHDHVVGLECALQQEDPGGGAPLAAGQTVL